MPEPGRTTRAEGGTAAGTGAEAGPEAELAARFRARRVRVTRRGRVVMAGVAFALGVALCAPVAWWAGQRSGAGAGAEAAADGLALQDARAPAEAAVDAAGSGSARSAAPLPLAEVEVAVAADEGWQDTGLFLRAEDGVRFRAVSGQWRLPGPRIDIGPEGPDPDAPTPMVELAEDLSVVASDEASAASGPQGEAIVARGPLPGAPYGALIARVGEGPAVLATGRIEAERAGRLYLRANVGDDRLGDAGGVVIVRITVEAGEDGADGTG